MTETTDATHPTLVVTGGPLDGSTFVVDTPQREKILGASTDCDFQLLLGNVEAVHARISRGPRGLLLSDAGSATGTYVNGEKIGDGYVLQDGDRICLGPPGAKESAKLLVKMPAGSVPMPAGTSVSQGFQPLDLAGSEPLVLVKPEHALPPAGPPPRDEPPPTIALTPPPPPPPPPPPAAFAPPPPPPPPPPAPPPAAAAPPPPPPPPVEMRRPAPRPDYMTEAPSMGEPVTHETLTAPPTIPPPTRAKTAALAKPRAARRGGIPWIAIAVLLAAALGTGAYFLLPRLLKKAPVLASVVPPRAEPGQTVTLSGKNFDGDPARNLVRFGDQLGQVTAASATQLAVTVPAGLAASDLKVLVESPGGRSNTLPLKVYRAPRVSGIEPDVAMPGDEIVVKGQNLDGKPLTVTIGGLPAEIKDAQAGSLRVVVSRDLPPAQGRTFQVNVQSGGDSAKPAELLIGRLPLILSVSPDRGPAGTRVTLKGRGFDPDPKGNLVTFGGQRALVLAAAAAELTIAAPGLVTQNPELPLQVQAKGGVSSSQAGFILQRVSTGSFIPRFFPSSVAEFPSEDLAFVSSDLGPLLLLGGKADAASTAERALRVSEALNGVVDAAASVGGSASRPPVFELRDKPTLGVGVAEGTLLVAAMPEDAAAYDKPWDPSVKGARRATPRSLAAYWTVLLQDYFALFVLRQRPLRVLELSPRGKILTEIYSEALRLAGSGAGIPTRVVLPPSAGMAKSLRDLALFLPVEGQARTAAALEGRWAGTMEEAGATREIQVRLRFEGPRLAGTFGAKAGGIEMNTPVRDIVYEKGALRFVVDVSGSSRMFSGTVAADAIAGTIQRTTGDKAATGRFTLKYVD